VPVCTQVFAFLLLVFIILFIILPSFIQIRLYSVHRGQSVSTQRCGKGQVL